MNALIPLIHADGDHLDDIRALFSNYEKEKWVEILQMQDEDGRTPLHWAVTLKRPQLFDYLVSLLSPEEISPIINCTDDGGWTPLLSAASSGQANLCQRLLQLGASAEVRGKNGASTLHYCCSKGHLGVMKVLMDGASLPLDHCSADLQGVTPLHRAAAMNHVPIVEYILSLPPSVGLDIDAVDANGETALFYACQDAADAVAQLLVEEGARIEIKNAKGQSALDVVAAPLKERLLRIVEG